MPVGRHTRRLTVNLPADVAGVVDRLAQGRGLSSSALAAQLLAAAVRSLSPRLEEEPCHDKQETATSATTT